mgnify:CR=1 FL=1
MKGEQYLLESATPAEYIERSIRAGIPRGVKASITHEWLKRTGYSIEDVVKARHRHPYWKKKKLEGNAKRNMDRIHAYNFSSGGHTGWDDGLIKKFLLMSKKLPDGSYNTPDYELAKHFGTTIPSIQYMRRKLNLVEKVLEKSRDFDMLSLMKKSEQKIKIILEGLNGN